MRKYSPLQKECLGLLRKLLKATSKIQNPQSKENFRNQIMTKFKIDSQIKRSKFDLIEFKLRTGKNQLKFLENANVNNIRTL
jgi:hypothetical protein